MPNVEVPNDGVVYVEPPNDGVVYVELSNVGVVYEGQEPVLYVEEASNEGKLLNVVP